MILFVTSNYDNINLLSNFKSNEYKTILETSISKFISKYLTHLTYFNTIILDTREFKDKNNILNTLITILNTYPEKKIIIIIHQAKIIKQIIETGIYNIINLTDNDGIRHELNYCINNERTYNEISNIINNSSTLNIKDFLYLKKELIADKFYKLKLHTKNKFKIKVNKKDKFNITNTKVKNNKKENQKYKNILLYNIFDNTFKVIYYIIVVAFASLGATIFINHILK